MTREEQLATAILEATAILCDSRSGEMALVLLMAYFKLHHQTKKEGATLDNLIALTSEGLRELESCTIPVDRSVN